MMFSPTASRSAGSCTRRRPRSARRGFGPRASMRASGSLRTAMPRRARTRWRRSKLVGIGCSVTRPACAPLLPQGGAIGVLKTHRGTADFGPAPHRLAVRIVAPAQGTIPSDCLA
jgi:hypothetical protein